MNIFELKGSSISEDNVASKYSRALILIKPNLLKPSMECQWHVTSGHRSREQDKTTEVQESYWEKREQD